VDNASLARMRRRGELEHVGKVVPRTDSGILYAQYMEALRAEERKVGVTSFPPSWTASLGSTMLLSMGQRYEGKWHSGSRSRTKTSSK
jgi:hypothetical protein